MNIRDQGELIPKDYRTRGDTKELYKQKANNKDQEQMVNNKGLATKGLLLSSTNS